MNRSSVGNIAHNRIQLNFSMCEIIWLQNFCNFFFSIHFLFISNIVKERYFIYVYLCVCYRNRSVELLCFCDILHMVSQSIFIYVYISIHTRMYVYRKKLRLNRRMEQKKLCFFCCRFYNCFIHIRWCFTNQHVYGVLYMKSWSKLCLYMIVFSMLINECRECVNEWWW